MGSAAIIVAATACAVTADASSPAFCKRAGTDLTVLLEATKEHVLARDADGRFTFDGARCADDATITTIDRVLVSGTWGGGYGAPPTRLRLSLENGPFAPGLTDEPGDSDEIEVRLVDSGFAGAVVRPGELDVVGGPGPDRLVIGNDGVNLNAGEDSGVDVDLSGYHSGTIRLGGGSGDDVLSGVGGAGTGLPASELEGDGGPGADTLAGSDYGNVMAGGDGPDTLRGGLGGDELRGGAGEDLLEGGQGEDELDGGAGADRLVGGTDFYAYGDIAVYADAPARVVVDLVAGTASDGSGAVDVLDGVEGARGSAFDDVLTGNEGRNGFWGGAGDDVASGAGGVDYAAGEEGADALTGAAGDDVLDGGSGDDVLDGGGDADRLTGGAGDDDFDGGLGRDRVTFGDARGVEARLADGLATFRDGSGSEKLVAIEDLYGGSGDDILVGDDGPNVISGEGGGHDLLRGRGGADTLVNHDSPRVEDRDVYDYSEAAGGVVIAGRTATDDGDGSTDALAGYGVELVGSGQGDRIDRSGIDAYHRIDGGDGNDTLLTGAGADTLEGSGGDDVIAAGGNNDVVRGGPGADRLDGGADAPAYPGGDRLTYAGTPGGVVLDAASGVVAADGEGGSDVVASFETITGSAHDDVLTGGAAGERLDGGLGDDTIAGGDGNDEVYGRAGDDALTGGPGSDTLGVDWRAPSGIDVDLSRGVVTDDGYGDSDTAGPFEVIEDTMRDDRITGDDGPNTVQPSGGYDIVDGRGGDDKVWSSQWNGGQLSGGEGNDDLSGLGSLYGGPGDDILRSTPSGYWTADYARAAGPIDADLQNGVVEDGDGGTDRLFGILGVRGSAHDDRIRAHDLGPSFSVGGAGDDVFTGGGGGDHFDGEAGRDRLDGGGGADRLAGGPGDDEIDGGAGGDVLAGDAGADVVRGGADNDDIRVRDAERDTASCGAGSDAVTADAASIDSIASDCERVERSAEPPPPPELEVQREPLPDARPDPPQGSEPDRSQDVDDTDTETDSTATPPPPPARPAARLAVATSGGVIVNLAAPARVVITVSRASGGRIGSRTLRLRAGATTVRLAGFTKRSPSPGRYRVRVAVAGRPATTVTVTVPASARRSGRSASR